MQRRKTFLIADCGLRIGKKICLLVLIFTHSLIDSFAHSIDSLKTQSLQEVTVKATRANEKSGFAYNTIYQAEIKKQNLGQDMPFLLNQMPSVVITSDAGAGVGYTGIRIRGSDPTRVNITLNGVPYNDSESHGTYWVNMPDFASSVSSIQVQRGVGTSTNGAGAFGASINVNTNQYETQPYAESNVTIGSFNTLKTNILLGTGLLQNHFVIDARLSKITSDGYIDRASSNLKSFYVSGAYYNKNNFVRLNVFSGLERTYQAWDGVPVSRLNTNRTYNSFTYKNQVDNYQQNHYQLISSFDLGKGWRLNPTLHYTKGFGYYEQFKEDEKLVKYGLPNVLIGNQTIKKTDLVRRKWLDNDFLGAVYSLDYENTKLKFNLGGGINKYIGNHFGEIIWAKYAPDFDYRWYQSKATKTDFNTFAKTYYQFTNKFNAFADLQIRTINYDIAGIADKRQDITQKVNYAFFNPKLGFTFDATDKSIFYGSYSVGNHEPSRQDFVENAPNVPQPEHLQDVELGFKHRTSNIEYRINGFFMDYKDQLVLTGQLNNVGEAIRVNVPKSYRAGIEMEMGYTFSEKLLFSGNATLSQNKITNFTETIVNYDGDDDKIINYAKTDISFSPNTIIGGTLTYKPTKNIDLMLLSKYVGKQYLDNTSNDARALNAFFVNDVRFSFSPKVGFCKDLTFSILANNILSKLYESNGYTFSYISEKQIITENFYYPQAPRNFLMAVKIRF